MEIHKSHVPNHQAVNILNQIYHFDGWQKTIQMWLVNYCFTSISHPTLEGNLKFHVNQLLNYLRQSSPW